MRYLLDTNAVSEALKTRPDPDFMRWLAAASPASELDEGLYISVLTIAEMRRGALKLEAGPKRDQIEARLADLIAEYDDRLLWIDLAVAERWATLAERYRRRGLSVGLVDELLAATALALDLTLVTRNVRHFQDSGCRVLSPWREE